MMGTSARKQPPALRGRALWKDRPVTPPPAPLLSPRWTLALVALVVIVLAIGWPWLWPNVLAPMLAWIGHAFVAVWHGITAVFGALF